jgi:hypothetical protein
MFTAAWKFLAKTATAAKNSAKQALVPVTGQPDMPTVMTPKVANKQQTQPSYVPTTTFVSAPLLKNDSRAASTDIASVARQASTTPGVIRALARLTPDLSAAVNAFLRVGIPEKWHVVARNIDGSFNRDATALATNILRQFDLMPDYASGFSQVACMRSLCESLGKELIIEGGCAMELVLDKNRMPYKFQPVSVSQIIFREDKDTQHIFPQQLISGDYIDLDQPTFFYTSLDQDLLTAYAISPLEGAVQPVLASADFVSDMRRICKRAVFPRYDVEIDEEKLRARMPPEVLNDTAKANEFLNTTIGSIQTVINSMNPEDAIVHFDFFIVKTVEHKGSDATDFETVKNIYDEKVSTGAKVMPSILGHGAGSQNVASTETMVFMLSANGMIRLKLQEILSKAMTLCVRLFGNDVTVEFLFDDIDLRPASELESFKSMKQARVLELLSLGFMSDDEAALQLTGEMTPAGFKPLSGTGFFTPVTAQGERPNPGGVPGQGDGTSSDPTNPNKKAAPLGNKQGANQQGQKSDAPSKPKGPQK